MPVIHLRVSNPVRPPIPTKSETGPFPFTIPTLGELHAEVAVVLSASGEQIQSTVSVEVSTILGTTLQQSLTGIISEFPDGVGKELNTLLLGLFRSQRKVVALLSQELRLPDNYRLVSGPHEWSTDRVVWRELYGRVIVTGLRLQNRFELDGAWHRHVRALLAFGEQPLLATEHLFEAERTTGKRFQWIEATIAAELAIKEALIKLEPKLEVVLLEVPSPPLRKLYGEILESVAGERSPYVSQLNKGAEIRNKLVHRPESVTLDPQDVVDYLENVAAALRHLAALFRSRYPNEIRAQLHPYTQS